MLQSKKDINSFKMPKIVFCRYTDISSWKNLEAFKLYNYQVFQYLDVKNITAFKLV